MDYKKAYEKANKVFKKIKNGEEVPMEDAVEAYKIFIADAINFDGMLFNDIRSDASHKAAVIAEYIGIPVLKDEAEKYKGLAKREREHFRKKYLKLSDLL